MKYCSVIITHYPLADDFGELRAIKNKHTRSEMLKMTMDSLEKNTKYPTEVIVVDNGGSPDDSDYLLDLTRKGVINIYLRNKNNMHFGFAWNQGIRVATGDHICLTNNDILFKPDWLTATMQPLLKYPEKKLIASPYITRDKMQERYDRGKLDGYRLNSMAGSNCMIMTKKAFYEMGEMTTHGVAGTIWHRRMHKEGYTVVIPPKDYVEHLGGLGGLNIRAAIRVKKILLKGQEVDFSNDGQKCVSIRGCRHQVSGYKL